MKIFNQTSDYFALDIGNTAVRVVQLSGDSSGWSLLHYGSVPVDIKISSSSSNDDQRRLGEVITTVIGQSGIRTRDVVVGIPSSKTFVTVVDMPDIKRDELAATIKYQAEQYIPMSTDEAKVDWALLGKSPNDQSKNEVLIAGVANEFSESRLDLVESLGLNVIAIEPDSIALARSLLPKGASDAKLIVEIGDFSTDIVVTYADAPRLIRSLPVGARTLVSAVSQNLNVQPDQAQQFVLKFGLDQSKLEGQVFRALETTLDQFTVEIIKSVKFFQTRYGGINIGSMIIGNYGASVPAFAEYLAAKAGLTAERGNPWRRVRVPLNDQAKLQPVADRFAVAVGLAQREGAE
jgi:type IV pilus assembly protein PilM